MLTRFTCLFCCLFVCVATSSATGIGIVDGVDGTYLHVHETTTSVVVTDQIAVVTCTQVFVNRSQEATEFKYAFPLNETANPTGLRWRIAGEWFTASISAEEQDSDIPGTGGGDDQNEEVDPDLTAYLGDFPLFFSPRRSLAPGDTLTMEITFVELLPYFLGKVSFYQKNDFSLLQREAPYRQTFDFELISRREVVAAELLGLGHDAELVDTSAMISFRADSLPPDFNYEVEYELSSEGLNATGLSTFIELDTLGCADVKDGYFTLIIEPESSVNTEVIEKNFTLIIDRSGSMGRDPIEQARQAASFITRNLNFGDNFNIIDFAARVTSAFPAPVPFSLETEQTALAYISDIVAGGSTNISGALLTAIDQFAATAEDKANIIIFFTDGEATAGIQDRQGILDAVADALLVNETSIFLYTVGIGSSLDRGLLIELARENNGQAEFISAENLEEELGRLFLSINNPVLINTEISITPGGVTEIFPSPVPNLYQGQQLILSGRYGEALSINVRLSGQAFNVPVAYEFPITLADSSNRSLSFLPKIWAKQKLDALQEDYYVDNDTTILNLIDSISVCYGVVNTNFSSFQDDGGGVLTSVEWDFSPNGASRTLLAYPTAFGDELTVDFLLPVANGPARVTLLTVDMKAATRRQVSITDGRILLTGLSDLPPGVYFLQIEVEGQIHVARVIKG